MCKKTEFFVGCDCGLGTDVQGLNFRLGWLQWDADGSEASWPSGHFSVDGKSGFTTWVEHDQAGAVNLNRAHGRGRGPPRTVESPAAAVATPLSPSGVQSRVQSPAFNFQNQGGKKSRRKRKNWKYLKL